MGAATGEMCDSGRGSNSIQYAFKEATGEVCDGGRGSNRIQYAFKENAKGYGGCLKA